jgi:hypothetical protein
MTAPVVVRSADPRLAAPRHTSSGPWSVPSLSSSDARAPEDFARVPRRVPISPMGVRVAARAEWAYPGKPSIKPHTT